jgi:ATP-dependent protease HslVU (ClpYQ) peptidase subunit
MAKQTSFAHQKHVLEQFLALLTGFESDFRTLIQQFEQEVTSLYEDEGLMEEIYEDYKATYLNSLNSTLLEIQTRIQEEDVPFIEKEIDFISSR